MNGIAIVQTDCVGFPHIFSPSIFKGMCYVNTLWNVLRKHCAGATGFEAVGRLAQSCDWAEAVERLEKDSRKVETRPQQRLG